MSGPKYSRALIEHHRALELLKKAQIMLDNEKKKELLAKIAELNRQLSSMQLDAHCVKFARHIEKAEAMEIYSADVMRLRGLNNELSASHELVPSMSMSIDELSRLAQKIGKTILSSRRMLAVAQTTDERICTQYAVLDHKKKEADFESTDWSAVKKLEYRKLPNALEDEYQRAIITALSSVNPSKNVDTLDRILLDERTDTEYKIAEIQLRRRAMTAETDAEEHEELIGLQSEFVALMRLLGKEGPELPLDAAAFRAAIVQLKKEYEEHTMAEYVNDALGKVMNELGYTIVGSDIVYAKNRTINKSTYNFSSSSMINVSEGSDGSTMFEIVGKANSANSKSAVCADMERFCPDYQSVKARLATHGIILENETLYPPSEEYVRFAPAPVTADRRAGNTTKRVMHFDG